MLRDRDGEDNSTGYDTPSIDKNGNGTCIGFGLAKATWDWEFGVVL